MTIQLGIITARAFSRGVADRGTRGAVVSTLQENLPPEARKTLLEQGVVPMQGLEECLLAIRGAAHIYQKQQRYREIKPLANPPLNNTQVMTFNEAQSKACLRDYGIRLPYYAICTAQRGPASGAKDGLSRGGEGVIKPNHP